MKMFVLLIFEYWNYSDESKPFDVFLLWGLWDRLRFFSIKSKKRRLKDERSNGRLQGKVISHETEHTDPLRLDDKWISTSEDWSCWYLNSKYPYNFAQFFVPFSPLQIAFLSLYTHLPKYLMDDEIRSCVENSIFQTFFCINNHSFNRLNHNDNLTNSKCQLKIATCL